MFYGEKSSIGCNIDEINLGLFHNVYLFAAFDCKKAHTLFCVLSKVLYVDANIIHYVQRLGQRNGLREIRAIFKPLPDGE